MYIVTFMPYIWITIAVFSLIIEAASLYYTAICFLPSALAALILSFMNFEIYVQVIIFFSLAALLLLIRFTLLRGFFGGNNYAPENLIGKTALVTETLDKKSGTGKIKIKGNYYRAEAKDENKTYEAGATVVLLKYAEGEKMFTCEEWTKRYI